MPASITPSPSKAAASWPDSWRRSLIATAERGGLSRAVARGWAAVTHNWRPFLLIQGCSFAAVAAYYALPQFGEFSETAARTKAQGGYLFSALTTVFASVALPEIAQRFTRTQKRMDGRDLAFRIGFFALIGVIVDAFYRLMAVIFGDSANWDVILRKVLVDQFVFAPLVSIPLSAAGFLWRDQGFRFGPTWTTLKGGAFWIRFAPMIVTCWAFWIPTLAAVYAMPARMQFVLFLFAQAAWSLLLIHMAEAQE